MALVKKFKALEKEFINKWGEYLKLHDELNLYRGVEIGENAETVNNLLINIQQTFLEMYPVMMFTVEHHQQFVKAIHDYQRFIDDIKKAGAVEIAGQA